jgi:NSS family neurotransmitter:Na+ symporter
LLSLIPWSDKSKLSDPEYDEFEAELAAEDAAEAAAEEVKS